MTAQIGSLLPHLVIYRESLIHQHCQQGLGFGDRLGEIVGIGVEVPFQIGGVDQSKAHGKGGAAGKPDKLVKIGNSFIGKDGTGLLYGESFWNSYRIVDGPGLLETADQRHRRLVGGQLKLPGRQTGRRIHEIRQWGKSTAWREQPLTDEN